MTQQKVLKFIQETLTVKQKEFITRHYVRVTLTGEAVSRFAHTTAGNNNKIFIPPKGVNRIHFPTFDFKTHQWSYPPEDVRPDVRTYTHRGFNADKNEMYIDFAVHGENGPASRWALYCEAGDILGVAMHDASEKLYPLADWYLLIGDASAIAVLSVILESLPSAAKGIAVIEVREKADEQKIETASSVQIQWLYNPHPEKGSQLNDFIRAVPLPDDGVIKFSYAAAEFSSIKNIRQYLRKEKGWTKDELYAYSYWKAGVSEDHLQNERAEEHYNS